MVLSAAVKVIFPPCINAFTEENKTRSVAFVGVKNEGRQRMSEVKDIYGIISNDFPQCDKNDFFLVCCKWEAKILRGFAVFVDACSTVIPSDYAVETENLFNTV